MLVYSLAYPEAPVRDDMFLVKGIDAVVQRHSGRLLVSAKGAPIRCLMQKPNFERLRTVLARG